MRTVEFFSLGCSPTSGGAQELVVVAKDGAFSHAHYFVRYDKEEGGDHRHLRAKAYQSPEAVRQEVRRMCRGNWVEPALKRVGC